LINHAPAESVVIRPAALTDIPQMCDLLSELFSIESDFSPGGHKQALGLALLINDASGASAVFVAEDGGKIAGMCSVQIVISTAEGGPVGIVEDLIVRRCYRGKGTGAELLARIGKWSQSKKITRLQLLRDADNAAALKFYACNGWSATKLLCMRKYL
jgi:GNAT superfamily N-acetyltransferase